MLVERCERCGQFFIPKITTSKVFIKYEDDREYHYCSYKCWKKDGGEDGRKYI